MKKLGSIGTVILLLIFLWSAVILIALGTMAYQEVVRSSKEQLDVQQSAQYLADKVREFDNKDGISIRHVQGTDVLIFIEHEQQGTYETWLYGYKGNLCELRKRITEEFKLREGKIIAKIDVVSIHEIESNLIKVEVKDEGGIGYTYVLSVRSAQEAVQYET